MGRETRKILVVEDEGLQALELNEVISDLGYPIVGTAFSAESALRIARESRPALAIIDIGLGTPISGIAVARNLSKHYGTRVVFVTGNRSLVDSEALDFDHILMFKPVNYAKLRRVVEKEMMPTPSL